MKPLFLVVFFDASKAFDMVDQRLLFQLIEFSTSSGRRCFPCISFNDVELVLYTPTMLPIWAIF